MARDIAPLVHHLRRLAAPHAADPDAALLDRFARGHDEAAFTDLVARHGQMVWHVCRRVLGDAHAAEDAFQATFLVLARRAGAIGQPAALAGWLYGVALRVARKARGAGFRHRLRQAADGPELSGSAPDPLTRVTARELLDALDEEVERLPDRYKLPVVLCCLQGLSQEEAARRLGWTPGSVRGRLERGRRRLHQRLTRRGLGLSAALAAAEMARGTAGAAPAAFVAGAAAQTLAEGVAAGTAGTKLKVWGALVLLAGLAASAGLLAVPGTTGQTSAVNPDPSRERQAPPPLRIQLGRALPMQAHAEAFWGLAFSPNGKRLAGGAHDGAVWVWDALSGKRVLDLETNAGIVRTVCFSHDGKRLAGVGGKVWLWDARTGAVRGTIDRGVTPGNRFEALAFSPDDRLLAGTAAGLDDNRLLQALADDNRYGILTLWDTTTGKVVRTLEGSGGGPVAWSLDGKRVAGSGRDAAGRDAGVRVWDPTTGKTILGLRAGYTSAVAFSPDSKRLAAGSVEGDLRVWDVVSGKEVHAIRKAHYRDVVSICFGPDGKYLVTAGQRPHERGLLEGWPPDLDGEVKVWSTATGKELLAFKTHVSGVSGMALTPDGTRVAASTLAGGQAVTIWALESGR
jgi:RNA polymerase sigma factor (sigma-70 family)